MNHSFFICLVCFCAASAIAQTEEECELIHLTNDDVNTFESASPYDKNLCLKVSSALGHKLEITVNMIDIDGKEPLYDYLIIKPGLDLDDPGDGKVFTHVLNTERSYVLFSNNAYFQFNAHLDSDGNVNPNRRKGFKMTYQRIGEETITTTTEPPDLNPLPTPGGNDIIYLTVYLSGKRLSEYTQVFVEKLRIVIIEMAKAYSEFAELPIDTDPTLNTNENVLVHSLMNCPWNWPDEDHCASMKFSLPLYMQPDYEGYQLNQTNLRNMWFHFNSQYLGVLGLRDYEAPDAQASINIWLIVTSGIVVAFAVFLGVFRWLLSNIMKPKGVSKLKEADEDDTSNSNVIRGSSFIYDNSQDDMQPDPYQTFPQAPAYDDDDNITYRIYDNHSKQKPTDINRVVLMDPEEYGEAYS